jgi:hypothetical protein
VNDDSHRFLLPIRISFCWTFTDRLCRNAVSLGESGKLEDARKVLSEALSKIMQSATAQDEYVKFLKKDLEVL